MSNVANLEPSVRNAHSQFIARIMGLEPVSIPHRGATKLDIQHRMDLISELSLSTLQFIQPLVADLNENLPIPDKINLDEFGAVSIDALNELSGEFRKLIEATS